MKNLLGQRLYHVRWRDHYGTTTEAPEPQTEDDLSAMGYTPYTDGWFTVPSPEAEGELTEYRVTVRAWDETDQAAWEGAE